MRRRISRFMGPPLANSKGKLSLAGQKTEVTEVTEEAPRHHHPIIAKSTLSALKKEKRSGRGREEVGKRSGRGQEEDKAWTQSRPQSPATEPSHRVQGRGQEEEKRRTRPGHRAGPQSPDTEFRGAAKRRARGGQGLDTNPGHRAQPHSPATQPTQPLFF